MSQNYSTSFTVPQSPRAAFAAVLDVRGWWSGNIDGPTDEVGAEFTYRYEDVHYTKQRITELTDTTVVWTILEADLAHAQPCDEWVGTQVHIAVTPAGEGAQVHFSHVGLTSELDCYDSCSNAWSFYINSSLRDLITTGSGGPNPAE